MTHGLEGIGHMEHKKISRVLGTFIASCVLLVGAGRTSAVVNIEFVTVGDVGNMPDTTGYGSVNYAYNIGKYEVTAGQYTEFLNAVAKTDTYNLFTSTMSNINYGCGITQTGSIGSFTYNVAPSFVNRPVCYVSYWDACRFTNWLQNGQPTGAQDANTTESGAYTLSSTGIANNSIIRNTVWQYAVTSENEWYKAAYYKSGSTNAGYWLYPTSSDTTPGYDINDLSGNNANYYPSGYPPLQSGQYLPTTVVGTFSNSASPYGTFDQGGNVWEWDETIPSTGGGHGRRGGSWYGDTPAWHHFDTMLSHDRYFGPLTLGEGVGFRVVEAVPEPTSVGLFGLGVIGMLMRRKAVAN